MRAAICHHGGMKRALLFVPIVLSLVVLGAHFMRYGNLFGVAGAALLLGLLFVRRPWVARLVQVVLVVGAVEWLVTLYRLAQFRAAMDQPAGRMIVILGTVAAVTALSALLFQTAALRRTYRL